MRWIVGGKAAIGRATSASQMGRFETRWLTVEKNLSALSDMSGLWIDRVQARRSPRSIVLDMDSSAWLTGNAICQGSDLLKSPLRATLDLNQCHSVDDGAETSFLRIVRSKQLRLHFRALI